MTELLDPLESWLLDLDTAQTPMHVSSLSFLSGDLGAQELKDRIEERIERLPRLQQLPSAQAAWSPKRWTEHTLDVTEHVTEETLDDAESLNERIGKEMSAQLDTTRPLWAVRVLRGLPESRTALVTRVHPAVIRSFSDDRLLSAIFDTTPTGTGRPGDATGDASTVELSRLQRRVHDASSMAVNATTRFASSSLALGTDSVRSALLAVGDSLPDWPLPAAPLPFNGRGSGVRNFSWTSLPEADIRSIRGALGGTLSDVVLTLLAGASAAYCRDEGVSLRGRSLRVLVPVGIVGGAKASALERGPQLGMLPVRMPLDEPDLARLHLQTRELTRVLRGAKVAHAFSQLTGLGALTPPGMRRALAKAGSSRPLTNFVATAATGPRIPLYVLGRRLLSHHGGPPVSYGHGLGWSFFAYNQEVHVGIVTDPALVPEPQRLRARLQETFEALLAAANVSTRPVIPTQGPARKRVATQVRS